MRVPFALRPAGSNRKSDMDDIVDEGRDDGDGGPLLLVKLSLLHKDVPPRKRSDASTIAQGAIRHAAK